MSNTQRSLFRSRNPLVQPLAFLLPAAMLLGLGLAGTASAEDWPNWRGPRYDGVSKETGWLTQWPATGPKQLWKASVGTGFATFTVSGGRVYTMGNAENTDTVYCLDADTGAVRWKHSYACKLAPDNFEGGPCGTPTVAGTAVYTCSRFGQVFALDADSGKVIWTKDLMAELGAKRPQWGFAGSAFIHGDLVVVNVGSFGTALDKKSGNVLWSTGTDASGYSTPVPFNQSHRGQEALGVPLEDQLRRERRRRHHLG
jgi:hypothetical protein